MGLIFQDFVRNFFRLKQDRFKVKGDTILFNVDGDEEVGRNLLPEMETDTTLYSDTRTIIIECKWTETLTSGRNGKMTLKPQHLRQLLTYMAHHKRTLSNAGEVEGLLLYPRTEPVNVAVRIKGQRLRVRTINFEADWEKIELQMLSLLEEEPSRVPVRAAESHPSATL